MKVQFVTRQKFGNLLQANNEPSITESASLVSSHNAGGEPENRLREFHDYGYAIGVRDCVSVALIPDNKEKKAKLLHLHTGKLFENLEAVDKFIRLDLSEEELKNTSSVIVGSLAPLKEFGDGYKEAQKKSQNLLERVRELLRNTGTRISEFTNQLGTWDSPRACESHIYVDRNLDTVYICADYLNIPLGPQGEFPLTPEGRLDESKLVPDGGIRGKALIQKFFMSIVENLKHTIEY